MIKRCNLFLYLVWLACLEIQILSLKLYTGSKLQDEIPEKDKLKDKDKEKNKEKEKSTEPKVTEEITESGLLSMQDLTHQDRLFFYVSIS